MPWYKSGTVSVTLNSNAVIGTGTAFLSNGRVGDAFRGPDGGWYEITNIASDTAMSISPTYKGATTAAGAYALAPMQGYVKDSADQLRALVNAYGAKLAALGTTGNYDLLPVNKGGTGGATAADARTALGIGTAGTRAAQANASDATAGALLGVGGFGVGGAAIGVTDANNATVGGTSYRLNTPYSNGPTAAPYSISAMAYDNEVSQLAFKEGVPLAVVFVRKRTGPATWGAWEELAKAGANSSITSLTGLTTALSVAQGGTGVNSLLSLLSALIGVGAYGKQNALGTVSQSGGVPTGAIIESGSNASGTYTKYADGTLIATIRNAGPFSVPALAATVIGPFSTPATFADANFAVFAVAIPTASNDTFGVIGGYAVTNSSASFVFRNGSTGQNVGNIKILCVGRWF